MNTVLLVIGVMLVTSVIKITRYLRTESNGQQINTKNQVMHAGAFGLFLVSVLIISIAYVFYTLEPDTETKLWYNIAVLAFRVLGFISECCIYLVLWQISK